MTRLASRTPLLSVLSLAVAVALAGCSSSSDDSPSDLQNDPEQPSDVVEPGDALEPNDMAEPNDAVEQDDAAEPGDVTEPNDVVEPGDAAAPDDMVAPTAVMPDVPGVTGSPTDPDSTAGPDVSTSPQRDGPESLLMLLNGSMIPELQDLARAFFVAGDGADIEGATLIEEIGGAPDRAPSAYRYACDDGGELIVGAAPQTGPVVYTLNECGIGGTVYGGEFTDLRGSFEANEFSATREGSTVEATGTYGSSMSGSGLLAGTFWSFDRFSSEASGLELTDSRVGEELEGSECAVTNPGCPFTKTLTVQLDVSAPWTLGQRLVGGGVLEGEGEGGTDTNYATGAIEAANADDSISVSLDADGGDPETFMWTRTADGSTISDSYPWSLADEACRDGAEPVQLTFCR